MFTLVCAWFLGVFLFLFYSSGQVSTPRALFLITHTIMPSKKEALKNKKRINLFFKKIADKSFKFSYQRDLGSADILLIY